MTFLQLFWEFFKAGIFAFGGGYALIPLIQKGVVEEYRWMTIDEFLEIVNLAGMSPGVFAANTATLIGYKVAKTLGTFASVLGVVLPSIVVIFLISRFFPTIKDNQVAQAALKGLRPAVVGLIIAAALTVGKTSITSARAVLIVIFVAFSVHFLKFHPILVLLTAGIVGILLFR